MFLFTKMRGVADAYKTIRYMFLDNYSHTSTLSHTTRHSHNCTCRWCRTQEKRITIGQHPGKTLDESLGRRQIENMQIVNICMFMNGHQISNVVVERNGYTNTDHAGS